VNAAVTPHFLREVGNDTKLINFLSVHTIKLIPTEIVTRSDKFQRNFMVNFWEHGMQNRKSPQYAGQFSKKLLL
jgi:hypothetical protein